MKRLYICPKIRVKVLHFQYTLLLNVSQHFQTTPNSVNGGDALGQESMPGGEEGDGDDAND